MKKITYRDTGIRKPPAQLRKDILTEQERIAITLFVLGGFSQSAAYKYSHGWHGSPSSLAPLACRWFAQPHIRSVVELYTRYYDSFAAINPKAF